MDNYASVKEPYLDWLRIRPETGQRQNSREKNSIVVLLFLSYYKEKEQPKLVKDSKKQFHGYLQLKGFT